MEEKWLPVASLNNLYEISNWGRLRNAKTGRVLKLTWRGEVLFAHLSINGTGVWRSINKILKETHGITLQRVNPPVYWVGVKMQNGEREVQFLTITAAIDFLAQETNYSRSHLRALMTYRKEKIGDWNITYIEGGAENDKAR